MAEKMTRIVMDNGHHFDVSVPIDEVLGVLVDDLCAIRCEFVKIGKTYINATHISEVIDLEKHDLESMSSIETMSRKGPTV